MKLKNILVVVNDLEKAKAFYRDLFGLHVIAENDGNVILTEGLVLQEANLWKIAFGQEIFQKSNASLLYFEESDIDGFVAKLSTYDPAIQYATPLTEFPWGSKMLRIYDLDGNLIEVRSPMK